MTSKDGHGHGGNGTAAEPRRLLRLLAPFAAAILVLAPSALQAEEEEDFDPARISEVDAIECRLDVPTYTGFAMSLSEEDSPADARGWKKVASKSPAILLYELPAPITVAGRYDTRRIAFSSSGIFALLDLPDPAPLAKEQQIENAMDTNALIDALAASGKVTRAEAEKEIKFRKFLGEKLIREDTEPAKDKDGYGLNTKVTRTISTSVPYAGKTFYGCTYRMEVLDGDGNPL
ncbi:hypothetical protein [Novosphingobium lindaniclasticum]|uniref:Uncharacterized protein n=1 Tax=Novosphingobium lindaniclasticum LE124 TaxID=1096930 RepID=T0HTD8_9SPHN|nr:hypothetical protein [Novosphingobium lindaniclasticum]EQB15368.1 hypothetical protein L284_12075 [Novosphingobium lindaniclasticum LE124]